MSEELHYIDYYLLRKATRLQLKCIEYYLYENNHDRNIRKEVSIVEKKKQGLKPFILFSAELRVVCVECEPEMDICLDCFAGAVTVGQHKPYHKYRLDPLQFRSYHTYRLDPLIYTSWILYMVTG
jgi:hypothetical protein